MRCLLFYLAVENHVTVARLHERMHFSHEGDHTMETPWCRHYRLAVMPVELQVMLKALLRTRTSFVAANSPPLSQAQLRFTNTTSRTEKAHRLRLDGNNIRRRERRK